MWHVALGSWQWIHQVAVGLPCKVTRGSGMTWHWIPQVAAPCNVAGGSGITCHWIRPNVRHIGILLLVSISTISPQSTCHPAPVCEILSKSDHPRQKKITSCQFSRWRILAILDFRGPIMSSLKSPCTTSYRSSIETMALNCLVFEKIAFFGILATDRQTDRQTDEQMDRPGASAAHTIRTDNPACPWHRRLRGSASTVLTATSQVNGRWWILTPHRIETHKPTATKFGTIDYVGKGTPKPNLVQIHPLGASGQVGEI